MSIIAYTGLPGHGKSYSVVENVLIPNLKAGRVVAHNFVLNESVLSVVCERDVSKQLVQIPRDATAEQVVAMIPPGAVIALDEVWRYWMAGTKANEVPVSQLAFFKEHRHRVGADGLSSEIVIVDQELGSGVARFIRDLVEMTYIHRKQTTLGLKKQFRVDVYSRAQNASKPIKAAHIRTMLGTYKPEVWNCYVSHTQSERVGEAGLENIADGRGTIWNSWTFRGLVAAVCLAPFALYAAVHSFGSFGKKPTAGISERSEAIHAVAPVGAAVVPPKPVVPSKPAESARWRLTGVIEGTEVNIATLDSVAGSRRVASSACKRHGLDWSCVVDGEIVTPWSGRVVEKESAFAGLVPSTNP